MQNIKTVGILGGGVIGGAWAARMVLNGIDVIIFDPDPATEKKMKAILKNAVRAYHKMTLAPLTNRGNISYAKSVEEMAEKADFIQENLPEREDLKRKILKLASNHARDDVVFASSTSGLLPTNLQADMHLPERLVVGHPFNPVYLMPLVEVCGGEKTSDATKKQAVAFYKSIGMKPLLLQKEIDGFIADRMMEALWREVLWLIEDDIATVSEIDDALRYGPGLRWAFMGPFLTYRLAGGEDGIRHFLQHFAPTLELPWAHIQAPEWTDELMEKIAKGSDIQAGDRSIRDYEALRDDCLVGILQALRAREFAAGDILKDYDEILFQRSHDHAGGDDIDYSQPLILHKTSVLPEWVDYNGHMTESRYLQVFGDNADALYRHVGVDDEYHKGGHSFYTVETHINNIREVKAGVPIHVTMQLLSLGEKKVQFFHEIYKSDDNTLLATCEQMALHVDMAASKATPMKQNIFDNLEKILTHHQNLPSPDNSGRYVGKKWAN